MTLQVADTTWTGTIPGDVFGWGYQYETDWYWSFVNYHYWIGNWYTYWGSWTNNPITGGVYKSIDWQCEFLNDGYYYSGLDAGLLDWIYSYWAYYGWVADDTAWGGSWTTGDLVYKGWSSYYWSGDDGTFYWDCGNWQFYLYEDAGDVYWAYGNTWYNLAGGWGYGYWWVWDWTTGLSDGWYFV